MSIRQIGPRLSRNASIGILTFSVMIVAAVEIKALIAREPSSHVAKKVDSVECIRCHSDGNTIKLMRMKEDGGNYLFNSDGSFKDPLLARNKDGSFKDPKVIEYLKKAHPGTSLSDETPGK